MILNREEIKDSIEKHSLITGFIDLDAQLTPNGFDLTVREVFEFEDSGALDFSNKQRSVPQGRRLSPQKQGPDAKFGWWNLKPGAYKIISNETVTLPKDLIALAFSRTSLLRMGAFTQNGAWDAGFKGKSEFILVVQNPTGIKLKQNARIIQLIFMRMNETDCGYKGIYQTK